MSVMLIRAVAVLDKPKFKLPSMSVAWTMMVYWDTFCMKKEKTIKDWYVKCCNKPITGLNVTMTVTVVEAILQC